MLKSGIYDFVICRGGTDMCCVLGFGRKRLDLKQYRISGLTPALAHQPQRMCFTGNNTAATCTGPLSKLKLQSTGASGKISGDHGLCSDPPETRRWCPTARHEHHVLIPAQSLLRNPKDGAFARRQGHDGGPERTATDKQSSGH